MQPVGDRFKIRAVSAIATAVATTNSKTKMVFVSIPVRYLSPSFLVAWQTHWFSIAVWISV